MNEDDAFWKKKKKFFFHPRPRLWPLLGPNGPPRAVPDVWHDVVHYLAAHAHHPVEAAGQPAHHLVDAEEARALTPGNLNKQI